MSPSKSDSAAYHILHHEMRRWIHKQGWKKLHAIQEQAIPAIIDTGNDVLIMAPTAGGKTEAAYLPILSKLLDNDRVLGISVLNISPLKALINDQYKRLHTLCEPVDITLTRWHGDASQAAKKNLLKKPSGVLLITPESLEALFMHHGMKMRHLFGALQHIVIDELHAFMGNVRGRQLQSQLCRLESIIGRPIPRIALSATIADVDLARSFLRPEAPEKVTAIASKGDGGELRLLVKGFWIDCELNHRDEDIDNSYRAICNDIYKTLRGATNLVFANSRREVELVSSRLIDLCEKRRVPVEFFPHHGSLSTDRRIEAENRLKKDGVPTTVIATNTLELGIDIGSVNSIAQFGAPPSVASMKQRIGRSGRRDGVSKMRIYCREPQNSDKGSIITGLHLPLIRVVATTNLMLKGWFEPPLSGIFDFSTLVQQTLSMICEKGGVKAVTLWDVLCNRSAFSQVDRDLYAQFLRSLAASKLIEQAPTGELLLGETGERLTSNYRFFAAFQETEEYRLISNGKTLGKLPILFPLVPDTLIVFAGRYWRIESVDEKRHEVFLIPSAGGRLPWFGGSGGIVHPEIRKECDRIFRDDSVPNFLNHTAQEILAEARRNYRKAGLNQRYLVPDEGKLLIFLWDGDRVCNTLSLQMKFDGLDNYVRNGVVTVDETNEEKIVSYLEILAEKKAISVERLVENVQNLRFEKHDEFLSDQLAVMDYERKMLDWDGLKRWLEQHLHH